jgi:hypothetical protein
MCRPGTNTNLDLDLDFADADEENGYQKCPLLDIFVAVSHSTSS